MNRQDKRPVIGEEEALRVLNSQLPSREGRWDGADLPEGWDKFNDDELDAALKAANRAVIEGKSEEEAIQLGEKAADEWVEDNEGQ